MMPDSSKSSCISSETSLEAAESITYSSTIGGTVAATAALNVGAAVASGASAQSMFSAVGQTQLLTLLPEIGAFMPRVVKNTISNLDKFMFSFNFLSLQSNPAHKQLEDTFGYQKYTNRRNLALIENGSTVLNLYHLILVFCLILLAHFILLLLKLCMNTALRETFYGKAVLKLNNLMVFGFYIKFIMLVYLFLLLASLYETNNIIKGNKGRVASHAFAIFILAFCVLTLIYSVGV